MSQIAMNVFTPGLNFCPASGAASSQASHGPGGVELPTSLTAEGLLLFCRTVIGGIEGDINAMMKRQLENQQRKSALSTVENAMKQHNPPKTEEDVAAIEHAFDEAIEALPPGDPTRKELEAMKKKTLGSLKAAAKNKILVGQVLGHNKSFVSKETWKGLIDEVGNMKDAVSDNQQLGMLMLQQEVANLQTIFQLSSNVSSKLSQTSQSIVGNISR